MFPHSSRESRQKHNSVYAMLGLLLHLAKSNTAVIHLQQRHVSGKVVESTCWWALALTCFAAVLCCLSYYLSERKIQLKILVVHLDGLLRCPAPKHRKLHCTNKANKSASDKPWRMSNQPKKRTLIANKANATCGRQRVQTRSKSARR